MAPRREPAIPMISLSHRPRAAVTVVVTMLRLVWFLTMLVEVADMTATKKVPVDAMNYVRAKSALQFDKYYALAGGINSFGHRRDLVDVSSRTSKRLNRDTLYSVAIVDISKGATVSLPDSGNRYMSLQVIN